MDMQKRFTTSEEKAFYVYGDGKLYSVYELVDALLNMPNETYNFHVNEHKNDFSNWLRDVFGLEKLAEEIRYLTKEEAANMIKKWLSSLESEKQIPESSKVRGEEHNNNKTIETIKTIVERVDTRFSDILEPTFMNFTNYIPEEIKEKLDALEDSLKEIESRISEERKQGHVFFLTPYLIRFARNKIKIARASWKKEDIEKAENEVEHVKEMLNKEVSEPIEKSLEQEINEKMRNFEYSSEHRLEKSNKEGGA